MRNQTHNGQWQWWWKVSQWLVVLVGWLMLMARPAMAVTSERMGIHVLNTGELSKVSQLFTVPAPSETWRYITIPFTLEDIRRLDEWQRFFKAAREQRIIPIVRIATKFEKGAWSIPSRYDVVQLAQALDTLEWPTDKRYVIMFNEVNHAKEWGGRIDPAGYARILRFASQWFKAQSPEYQVLPAAMDLAAPDGRETRSAFAYFDGMLATDSEVFADIDYWNSHSYPNPGFSAPPYAKGVNSLWGFGHELTYIKNKTGRDLQVFITETGWANNAKTRRWLEVYYTYALQHIWSDPRVVAVTPFVLKGDPGPFAEFGFLDRNDQPTVQYKALQNAILKAK